jgi:hypothetical protein
LLSPPVAVSSEASRCLLSLARCLSLTVSSVPCSSFEEPTIQLVGFVFEPGLPLALAAAVPLEN